MPNVYIRSSTVRTACQIAAAGQFPSQAEAIDDALRLVLWLVEGEGNPNTSRLWSIWQGKTRGGQDGSASEGH